MALLYHYQLMLLQTINSVIELVNKRPQLTLLRAILVPVIQVMLYFLLLVQLINVMQFVMQHHQLTKPQAILVIVLMALLYH
jgi:hypothetical protein